MERRPVLYPGQHRRLALTPDEIRARIVAAVPGRRRSPTQPPPEIQPVLAGDPLESVALDLPPGASGAGLPLNARGDHDLNPGMRPRLPLKTAAVLIGLIERPAGIAILLTRRTENLTDHAGQISFPGGRIDPHDRDPETAALREAAEEVRLDPACATVIGRIDTYVTRTGYEIVPVVALLRPPLALVPDPAEVAEIFELPLEELLRPGAMFLHSQHFEGIERWYYALDWDGHHIWGATAGMLNNLIEALGARA